MQQLEEEKAERVDDDAVYEEIDESEYEERQRRLQMDDFVEDDEGESGYVDDGDGMFNDGRKKGKPAAVSNINKPKKKSTATAPAKPTQRVASVYLNFDGGEIEDDEQPFLPIEDDSFKPQVPWGQIRHGGRIHA